MQLLYIIRTVLLLFLSSVSTDVLAQEKIIPISMTALADSMDTHPKPILMLISTDWCSYCQMQKIQLRRNKEFRSAKDRFYYVELNAETKDSIRFNSTVYRYKNMGASTGVHELAIELANNEGGIAYPTWIFLDEEYKILFRYPGVLTSKELTVLFEAIGN